MLAIGGGKGGCGKTTVTLGVAGAAGRRRRSVLAVDADRQMPNLHLAAGVPREPTLSAVADGVEAMTVAHRLGDCPGVWVLGAPADPSVSIDDVADRLRGAADVVLLDCPAGAGPDAVDPLAAADGLVLVTTTDDRSARDAAKTAAMARTLGTPVLAVALTKVEAGWTPASGVPLALKERMSAPIVPVPAVASDGRDLHRLRRLRGHFDRLLARVNGQQT